MKKFAAAFTALVTAFSLAACAETDRNGGTPPEENDYGALTIADTYAWLGDYPATELAPVFEKPEKAETLTYSFDGQKIEIDGEKGTVRALQAGQTTVTASSENFSATFTVICEEVDKDTPDKAYSLTHHANGDLKNWDARVRGFRDEWASSGRNGMTTLFIGDSFFDCTGFWTSFYTDYLGKDALCWGIGSTTTCAWETIADELLCSLGPKNVVFNCGTNNVYDIKRSADDIVSSLERFFSVMHDALPTTNFYWFNIAMRYYELNDETILREGIAEQVNERFTAWAKGRGWLTVIDARSKLRIDMCKPDGLHPNADGYAMYMEELAKTNIRIYDR